LIELFLNRTLVALGLNISRSFCSNLEHLQMLRDLLSVNSRHFSLYPVWQCNCKFRWVPGTSIVRLQHSPEPGENSPEPLMCQTRISIGGQR